MGQSRFPGEGSGRGINPAPPVLLRWDPRFLLHTVSLVGSLLPPCASKPLRFSDLRRCHLGGDYVAVLQPAQLRAIEYGAVSADEL